jgi:subtilisin-like proprotein convertase family protein
MPDGIHRDARRACIRFTPAPRLPLHAAAAFVLALASACGGSSSDSAPPGGNNLPLVYTSTDVPKSIPDRNATGVTSYLTVSGAPTSLAKVTVKLSIFHSYDGDLYISLFSPSGTEVALSNINGGSGANYTNTVFDDAASISIAIAGAPFTGTYKPQWPLYLLNGENANGTWRLKVVDAFPGGTGTLQSWSIQIW